MRYEAFRDLWLERTRESGLRPFGFTHETLDTESLDRRFEIRVEPVGGQDAEGYTTTAKLSWRWDSLMTARSATTEDDMVTELFGRQFDQPATEPLWLRVNVELAARLHHGTDRPLPAAAAWRRWSHEVHERLTRIEPLVPEDWTRDGPDGLEILAWQSSPTVDVECTPDGELRFQGVGLEAFQILRLPRQLDGDDEDEWPGPQLDDLLGRVRAALHAWMETLDALDGPAGA